MADGGGGKHGQASGSSHSSPACSPVPVQSSSPPRSQTRIAADPMTPLRQLDPLRAAGTGNIRQLPRWLRSTLRAPPCGLAVGAPLWSPEFRMCPMNRLRPPMAQPACSEPLTRGCAVQLGPEFTALPRCWRQSLSLQADRRAWCSTDATSDSAAGRALRKQEARVKAPRWEGP